MVKCICINDSNRPPQISLEKWIKKDSQYHVVFTCTVLPQRKLGFQLAEIDLDENCAPFEYFSADRFGFNAKDIDSLKELIKNCKDIDSSIESLLSEADSLQTTNT